MSTYIFLTFLEKTLITPYTMVEPYGLNCLVNGPLFFHANFFLIMTFSLIYFSTRITVKLLEEFCYNVTLRLNAIAVRFGLEHITPSRNAFWNVLLHF